MPPLSAANEILELMGTGPDVVLSPKRLWGSYSVISYVDSMVRPRKWVVRLEVVPTSTGPSEVCLDAVTGPAQR